MSAKIVVAEDKRGVAMDDTGYGEGGRAEALARLRIISRLRFPDTLGHIFGANAPVKNVWASS